MAEIKAAEVPFGDARPDEWPEFSENSKFWSAIIEAEEQIQVPREMALMCALGAISIAGQGLVDAEMPTGHRVQTSLMLLTLADSGERKTTVQKYFFKSINAMNRRNMELSKHRRELYSNDLMVWQVEEKAAKSCLTRAIKGQDERAIHDARQALKQVQVRKPASPVLPRLLYDDATPQALVQHLHEYSSYGGLVTSEANSIFSGRALQELDKMNTLWDGGDVIVDRLTRPSFILTNARLTLALMTQPSVIERFLSKRGEEARGMGFLARFLVVKPRKMSGERTTSQIGPLPAIDAFNERIEVLLRQESERQTSPENMAPEKKVLTFSSEAGVLWKNYAQGIENAMADGQPYYYYADHAAKLMDNITRMAALLHCFEGFEGPISRETLSFCYDVARKCSTHFQRYLAGEPQVVTDASALARFCLEQADSQGQALYSSVSGIPKHLAAGREYTFTLTDLKQYGPYRLRGRENDSRLRAALHLLEKMGHVTYERGLHRLIFRENIFSDLTGPVLRNGIEYCIESLPFFDQQQYYKDPRPSGYSNYSGYYLIKPDSLAS
jgi:hypothetical protein